MRYSGKATELFHCLTGVSLGIGFLVLLNQLRIPFYLYYPRTTQTVLSSEFFDLCFFIASSVCVPMLVLSFGKFSRLVRVGILLIWVTGLILTIVGEPYGVPMIYATIVLVVILDVLKSGSCRFAGSLLYTLAFFILIEFAAVCYWAGAALNPRVGNLSEQLEVNLTFSLYPLVMLVMLLLLFSWAWIPVASRIPRFRSKGVVERHDTAQKWNLRLVAASLDLFAIVSILVFFYPYMAGQTWIVGVDAILRYLGPLSELAGITPSQAVFRSSQHGLYLVLLYLIQLATGASSSIIVKYATLFLAFGTASVVFLTILKGGWSFRLAILASVCVLLWLPTTLGMYAAIQANWFAYLLWMLFLSFYFINKDWSMITFISQGLLSIAIFVVHPRRGAFSCSVYC